MYIDNAIYVSNIDVYHLDGIGQEPLYYVGMFTIC